MNMDSAHNEYSKYINEQNLKYLIGTLGLCHAPLEKQEIIEELQELMEEEWIR